MSIHVIIPCTSLGNLFLKSNGSRYFKASLVRQTCFFFFLNLDFIRLRVPELITTNKPISYKTNSTSWNLKSSKSLCGISGISVVIYNIYSPEGNYFGREEGKFLFWGENSPNSIKQHPKLKFILNHQHPNQLSFTTNYNLHYIFCLSIFNSFLFFLIVTFRFPCTCYLLTTLKQSQNHSACEA